MTLMSYQFRHRAVEFPQVEAAQVSGADLDPTLWPIGQMKQKLLLGEG